MSEKQTSTKVQGQKRIIQFLLRLFEEESLSADDLLDSSGVTVRTLQRDSRLIRDVIGENHLEDNLQLVHNLGPDNYKLIQNGTWDYAEVLAMLNILIGTRALSKARLIEIKNHLLKNLSADDQNVAKMLIEETISKYRPVKNDTDVMTLLEQFSKLIKQKTPIKFKYNSSVAKDGESPNKLRLGIPISMYFAENYFYVLVYMPEVDKTFVYRLDRFTEIHISRSKQIRLPQARKIDVGELRNRTYLLSGGKRISYRFRYWGYPQTALDKLPDSKLISTNADGSVTIGGRDLSEQGAMLWVLGQGSLIKVEQPASLIERLKAELKKTLGYYE